MGRISEEFEMMEMRNRNLPVALYAIIGVVMMGSWGTTVTLAAEGDALADAAPALAHGVLHGDGPAAAGAAGADRRLPSSRADTARAHHEGDDYDSR